MATQSAQPSHKQKLFLAEKAKQHCNLAAHEWDDDNTSLDFTPLIGWAYNDLAAQEESKNCEFGYTPWYQDILKMAGGVPVVALYEITRKGWDCEPPYTWVILANGVAILTEFTSSSDLPPYALEKVRFQLPS
jgi:hypothetical protein